MSLIPMPCPKCGRFHGCPPPESKLTVSDIMPEWAALYERAMAVTAAEKAVKDAAMDRHAIETGTSGGWLDEADVLQRYNAACAALAKLERP